MTLFSLSRWRNTEYLTNLPILLFVVHKPWLRWYGRVLRSSEDSVAKITLALSPEGKRLHGRPNKRWLDQIKENNVTKVDAVDCTKWRQQCRKANRVTKQENTWAGQRREKRSCWSWAPANKSSCVFLPWVCCVLWAVCCWNCSRYYWFPGNNQFLMLSWHPQVSQTLLWFLFEYVLQILK